MYEIYKSKKILKIFFCYRGLHFILTVPSLGFHVSDSDAALFDWVASTKILTIFSFVCSKEFVYLL